MTSRRWNEVVPQAQRCAPSTARPPPRPSILAVALPSYASPAIALIAGILILIRPALLAKIVAIYLIIVGVLGLLD